MTGRSLLRRLERLETRLTPEILSIVAQIQFVGGAELRDQFEWAKAQTLGLIVVATYLLDKIIGWDKIKLWLWTIFQHR